MEYSCPKELSGRRLVVLDIETTGLSPVFNNIIEVGMVEVKDGRIVNTPSILYGGGRSPMYLIRNVHKIRDKDRAGLPTFMERAGELAEFLNDAVLVTHNGAKFDISFIERKMAEARTHFSYARHIDTYQIAKALKKQGVDAKGRPAFDSKGKAVMEPIYEHHSLKYLCGELGIPYGEENHRGGTDCLCTLQVLYAFYARHPESMTAI